jgi:hypothetical protein
MSTDAGDSGTGEAVKGLCKRLEAARTQVHCGVQDEVHKQVTQKASNFLERDVEIHLRPGPVCYSAFLHFMDCRSCLT